MKRSVRWNRDHACKTILNMYDWYLCGDFYITLGGMIYDETITKDVRKRSLHKQNPQKYLYQGLQW